MHRLSLSMLAAAAAAILVLITAVLAVAILDDINEARTKGDQLQHEVDELRLLRQFESALFIEVGSMPAYILSPDERYARDFEDARVRAASALQQLEGLDTHGAEEDAALQALTASYADLTAQSRGSMDALVGNPAEVELTPEGIGAFVDVFYEVQASAEAASTENEARVVDLDQQVRDAVRERSQLLLALVGFWSGVILATTIAAYWLVARPIVGVSHVARAFARGERAVRATISGPRELSQLGADMNFMLETTNERARALEMEALERRRIAEALERTLESERALRDQLQHQAFHDPLTGLSNRARFIDRLDHALARRTVRAAGPSLLFLDLDDFKSINDTLGHAAGDDLRRQVGERLQACLRPADTLARLGGDEFGALIEEALEEDALIVAERILDALRMPFTIADREVFSRASVGVVQANHDVSGADLLRHADVAMYVAKSQGKSRVIAYRDDMEAAMMDEIALENDLQRALERNELVVQYQPVVGVADEALLGFEALLRWRHPSRGMIEPDAFIYIAERTGLVMPIGEWVLRQACDTLARWQERYPHHPSLTMSVNVSARQLGQPDFTDAVAAALRDTGIAPNTLILEITESAMMADGTRAIGYLQTLHELGVRLAVDDFGTGYSSLSYLRNFPLDELKVDKSFVDHVTESGKEEHVVRSIIGLAKALHLKIVAEGVERGDQLEILRAFDCDEAQGFLFSTAMDADDAERLLERGRQMTRAAA